MALVPTTSPSNSYSFWMTGADITLEGFARCGIRPSSLTQNQLVDAYRSINLALQTWSNRPGPNLWKRTLISIPLIAGVATYNLDTNTVQMLDVYVRNYPMGAAQSIAVAFATVINTPTVTITWANHGLGVGNWINVIVPVSIGGLIIESFYTVTSVPNTNTITITATANATSSATGGAVPTFTTTGNSATVTVTLAAHGLSAGENFSVQVQTTVSDIVLFGSYTVGAVLPSSQFTITAPNAADVGATVAENGGLAQLTPQNINADPVDRILYPISETDYAALPDKFVQGLVTSFFFNKLAPTPNVVLWQVPNNQGPWVLQFYAQVQVQDLSLGMGQTPDIDFLFFEALCADIAARLAQKFAYDRWPALKADAMIQWKEAADRNTEKVSLYIAPDVSQYYD